MKKPPLVRLKGELRSPHPWVWKTRVQGRPKLPAGGVVRVEDEQGQPLGSALFHPQVTIALRRLSADPSEAIDAAFFRRRFERALALRRDALRLQEAGNAFRLVHAEADGLSGLVVDVLGEVVRVDVFARGMALLLPEIRAALGELFPEKALVARADKRSGQIEGFSIPARPEDPPRCEVIEHGVRFEVDLREGHKTGFFLDQRENRSFLAHLARGRSVLDCCTYTGGFALHAAVRGQAREVTGVDLDEKAIAVAKRNAKLNQARVKFSQADAFAYLRERIRHQKAPEVLILDPPKLAKDRKELDQGLRSYRDLNRLGLEAIAEGGFLLTCSCSGVVSEEDLLDVLRNSAAKTGKALNVIRISGAAADHPVGLHVPETRYLKAVFAQVHSL